MPPEEQPRGETSGAAAHANREDGPPVLSPEFMRKLERLMIAVQRTHTGFMKGERKSKRKGSSVEFADYRDYVQGDDLRHVDWNIFGRLDSMYLKLFQESEDLPLHVLIDGSKSMLFGTPRKFDFARRLAAAIGYIGLVGYDRVTVEQLAATTEETGTAARRLAPIRGKGSARKLFAFLEGLQGGGSTHLESACRSFLIRNRKKGVALLISDFFDEDGFEGALKQMAASGSETYAVQVLAPEEIDPKLSGDLKLVDSETGGFVEISVSRALLKRYRKNRDGFIERVRGHCHARGISHFIVSSDTPIERVAFDLLRKGGMVR